MVCELRVILSITQAKLPAAHLLLLLLLGTHHHHPPTLTLLLLTTVVFLLKPSAHNSLLALSLSLSRCLARTLVRSRSLSEDGVIDWPVRLRWEVCSQCGGGLHLSQRQSIATALLPFKPLTHADKQGEGGKAG